MRVAQAFGVVGTLFIITFLAHMLACFYYFIGENSEQLGNGIQLTQTYSACCGNRL
jgi:hypothetical protein